LSARRLAKSRDFFARRALAAAGQGDKAEAMRLLTWATRKKTLATLAAI
jgi:hypothetical protein